MAARRDATQSNLGATRPSRESSGAGCRDAGRPAARTTTPAPPAHACDGAIAAAAVSPSHRCHPDCMPSESHASVNRRWPAAHHRANRRCRRDRQGQRRPFSAQPSTTTSPSSASAGGRHDEPAQHPARDPAATRRSWPPRRRMERRRRRKEAGVVDERRSSSAAADSTRHRGARPRTGSSSCLRPPAPPAHLERVERVHHHRELVGLLLAQRLLRPAGMRPVRHAVRDAASPTRTRCPSGS